MSSSQRGDYTPRQPLREAPSNQTMAELDKAVLRQSRMQADELYFKTVHLEEVVVFMGRENDAIKAELAAYKSETALTLASTQREKESLEAEVRKQKELLKDKASECESIARSGKRQRELLELQNDRLRSQLKTVIQKKNDELFAVTRERDQEINNIRKGLEGSLEQQQSQHKIVISQLQQKLESLELEVNEWKAKYTDIQSLMQKEIDRLEGERTRIVIEHEERLEELREEYYRSKVILIDSSQAESAALEQASQIQRDIFAAEVEQLKECIQRLEEENSNIREENRIKQSKYMVASNQQKNLIHEMEDKLKRMQEQHERQLELMKAKSGCLHAQDLNSQQEIWKRRIEGPIARIQYLEEEVKKLEEILSAASRRELALLSQMTKRESQAAQTLARERIAQGRAEEGLRQFYETERSLFLQQSAQAIKSVEARAGNFEFQEEELRKLRKFLDIRVFQNEQLEKTYQEQLQNAESQINRLKQQIELQSQQYEKASEETSISLQAARKQISRLNAELLATIRSKPPVADCGHGQELSTLKQRCIKFKENEIQLLQRCDVLERRCRESEEQLERAGMDASVAVEEARTQWEQISNEKLAEITEFYQRKLREVEGELEACKSNLTSEQVHSADVLRKYQELEFDLREVLQSLSKRSQLQELVLQLGQDGNLLKNKLQLFPL